VEVMMNLELTESERELLAELLEVACKEKLRELNHTATMAFKQQLRRDIETIERLQARLADATSGAPR
jgi:hypothetical protein